MSHKFFCPQAIKTSHGSHLTVICDGHLEAFVLLPSAAARCLYWLRGVKPVVIHIVPTLSLVVAYHWLKPVPPQNLCWQV